MNQFVRDHLLAFAMAFLYSAIGLRTFIGGGQGDQFMITKPWSLLIAESYQRNNAVMNYFFWPFLLLNAVLLFGIGWAAARFLHVRELEWVLLFLYAAPGVILWAAYAAPLLKGRPVDGYWGANFAIFLYTLPGSLLLGKILSLKKFYPAFFPFLLALNGFLFYGIGVAIKKLSGFICR